MTKRGHSNVSACDTKRWPGDIEIAQIPLGGGASLQAWKALPPLALRREEWETIGRKMGWIDPNDQKV